MKYILTIKIESTTDIEVESETDLDKLSLFEKQKFMEQLEHAAMSYYKQNPEKVEKHADAHNASAVFWNTYHDGDEEPEIKIKLEDVR